MIGVAVLGVVQWFGGLEPETRLGIAILFAAIGVYIAWEVIRGRRDPAVTSSSGVEDHGRKLDVAAVRVVLDERSRHVFAPVVNSATGGRLVLQVAEALRANMWAWRAAGVEGSPQRAQSEMTRIYQRFLADSQHRFGAGEPHGDVFVLTLLATSTAELRDVSATGTDAVELTLRALENVTIQDAAAVATAPLRLTEALRLDPSLTALTHATLTSHREVALGVRGPGP